MAILKSEACYVPLDPAHPAERLEYLLHDSAPVAILTQQNQGHGWLEEYCIRSFSWGSGTGRAEVAHYAEVAGLEHGRRGVSDTRNPDIQMDG